MRYATLVMLVLAAGCAPLVSAQDPSSCRSDADCVIVPQSCCPGCCECPRVMTRAQREQADRICAVAECAGRPDCSHVRCEPCGIITRAACEGGHCIGR